VTTNRFGAPVDHRGPPHGLRPGPLAGRDAAIGIRAADSESAGREDARLVRAPSGNHPDPQTGVAIGT
jgi:hypothetical protein